MWEKLTRYSVMQIKIQDRLRDNKYKQFNIDHISLDHKTFTIFSDPIIVKSGFNGQISTERKVLNSEYLVNNCWEIYNNI